MSEKVEQKVEEKPEKKKKPLWRRIVGGILTAILILALIASVVIVVLVKRTQKPFIFGYATYFVVSGSMEPTIKVKDVIIVKKVEDASELKVSDIITFIGKGEDFNGKIVTHRIIEIEETASGDVQFRTQGDANHNIPDKTAVPYENVIGKYVKTSAFLTTIYMIFSSKYGFLIFVFIPLLALLIVQVLNFRKACRMDKDGILPEEKAAEEVKEQAVKEKEDEIKRKAIEEYLASKKRIEEAQKKMTAKKKQK